MNDRKKLTTFCLIISCPDTIGIVAAISQFVSEHGGSLVESNHHTDISEGWFYMRNVIATQSMTLTVEEFRKEFSKIACKFNMEWYVRDSEHRQKVVLLASSASHCLADLLHRWKSGELNCEIPCVISNHQNLRSMVEWHGIPFHHVHVPKDNKQESFDAINVILDRHNADTVVLARYMQILPPNMCKQYKDRFINIHHSFLPAFIGSNPYERAFERGVKLIGATCHYVTEDLDEGPIIEQDVIRVSHSCEKDDLARLGRDVEKAVLARGLLYHLEDRVIVRGNKAVVF